MENINKLEKIPISKTRICNRANEIKKIMNSISLIINKCPPAIEFVNKSGGQYQFSLNALRLVKKHIEALEAIIVISAKH